MTTRLTYWIRSSDTACSVCIPYTSNRTLCIFTRCRDEEQVSSYPYGQYGSPYSPNSINNQFGTYCSPYSPQGANNPYGSTSSPQVYGSNGAYLGRMNANPYDPNSVANPYGQYGSQYSPNSINNQFGT